MKKVAYYLHLCQWFSCTIPLRRSVKIIAVSRAASWWLSATNCSFGDIFNYADWRPCDHTLVFEGTTTAAFFMAKSTCLRR